MDPKIWSKCWWNVLFSSALGYSLNPSIDEQSAYSRFYRLFSQVLPCESCKAHFEQHYRNVPINFYLYSRRALLDWVLMLHNEVNKSLGQPPLTLDEAILKYLGPDVVRSEVFRQCVQSAPIVLPRSVCDSPPMRDFVSTRPNCPTNDDQVRVVEGFSMQNMDYKDVTILVLLAAVLYLLYQK